MSIVFKLARLTLIGLSLSSSAVYAQALRPGAPAQPAQQSAPAKPAPQPATVAPAAPSVATLPPASGAPGPAASAPSAPNASQPSAVVAPASVQAAPVEQPNAPTPSVSQSRTGEVNPFIPNKPTTSAAPTSAVAPSPSGALGGQTLGAPGAMQPNFNGQFPINTAQPVGPAPGVVEPEEKVHPVIERGTFIGKVNGKPIYKAPREYYFDKPGAEVIYKPKQEVAPAGEQSNQPGQRGSRPGQRTTNTNR